MSFYSAHMSRKCTPDCAKRARARLLNRMLDAPAPERFLTLTNAPQDYQEALRLLVRSLRAGWKIGRGGKIIKGGVRPRVFEYFYAGELGAKTSMRHLHVLQRGDWVGKRHLSRLWAHFGGGKITDIRKVHDSKCGVLYVTKYVMKGAGFEGGKGYGWSRGYFKGEEKEVDGEHRHKFFRP
jgi:hypothetical protein